MKPLLALLTIILIAQMFGPPDAQAQSPTLVGRWRVEYTLSDSRKRVLQFDALASGKGSFLSLGARSSLSPAVPMDAEWSQTTPDQVSFSGEIEFPIGNVGSHAGRLSFKGAFASATSISGEATFTSDPQDPSNPTAVTGTFTATRVASPKRPLKSHKKGAQRSRSA